MRISVAVCRGRIMTKERYDYIDTLRLFSILFIVLSHFDGECFAYMTGISMIQTHLAKDGSLGLLMYGWTGKYALALLCVISGFLVAMKYADGKSCDVGGFIITRYFRMMLPVMANNLVFGIWLKILGENVDVSAFFREAVIPGLNGVNRNLWCIGSFLTGNILVCLICYLQNRKPRAVWLYAAVVPVLVCLQDVWLLATVAGGICFEAASRLKRKRLVNNWWLLGIAPIVWLLARGEESTEMYYRDMAAAVLIMTAFYCLPILQRIFACRFLKPLKKCCYSLFVVHGMTLFLVGPTWNLVQGWGIRSGAGIFISCFLVLFLIDLAIAYVVYYLSEVKLYKVIIKRFFA